MKREITIHVWNEVAYRLNLNGGDREQRPAIWGRAIELSDASLDLATRVARPQPTAAARVLVRIGTALRGAVEPLTVLHVPDGVRF